MHYLFDELVDRSGSDSIKWERDAGRDIIPLWVADMDFRAPPEVVAALGERISHAVFGYTRPSDSYREAVAEWLRTRHGWSVERDWIVPVPGTVTAIRAALETFTRPGDGVVVQPPVYHRFLHVPPAIGRRVVENPLNYQGGRYTFDLEGLRSVTDATTRVLLLCSPHNPVGRVWTTGELADLAVRCEEKELLIFSDEIHLDLVLGDHRHIPMAVAAQGAVGREAADRVVTFLSATKTFNVAGLPCATVIIPDGEARRRFHEQLSRECIDMANVASLVATEAAYRHGGVWLDELRDYLSGNYRMLLERFAAHSPELSVTSLEGTYLVWVDFGALGLSDRELTSGLLAEGVRLEAGPAYGRGGEGFQRINIACPRERLRAGLERIERFVARAAGR